MLTFDGGVFFVFVSVNRRVYRWRGRKFVVKNKMPRLGNYVDGKITRYTGIST